MLSFCFALIWSLSLHRTADADALQGMLSAVMISKETANTFHTPQRRLGTCVTCFQSHYDNCESLAPQEIPYCRRKYSGATNREGMTESICKDCGEGTTYNNGNKKCEMDSPLVTCGDGTWKNSNACTACDAVTNAATVTCSAAGNSVAATCDNGYWKNSNANHEKRNLANSKSCTACDAVTNAATVTCSAAGNSVAATCDNGYWKNSNACTACDAVTNAATITCSAAGNSVAATCDNGYWKNGNACTMMCDAGTTYNQAKKKCEMASPLVTCGDGTTLTANKCEITSPSRCTTADKSAAAKQVKVVVTVTLTGVTEEQVTPAFKKAFKNTYAAKAGVDPSQVTLTFVYTKAATRRLAAGDTVAVTATIAVADAAAATKVSANVVKLEPAAFIATLKKELKKEGSAVDLTAVTATIAPPTTTGAPDSSSDKGTATSKKAGLSPMHIAFIVLAMSVIGGVLYVWKHKRDVAGQAKQRQPTTTTVVDIELSSNPMKN